MADEITKEQFDKLQSDLTASLEASKGFQESITKLEDNNKALLSEKAAAKKAAQTAAEEAAKGNNDLEAYRKSVEEKHTSELEEKDALIKGFKGTISKMTSGESAQAMAAKLGIPKGGAEGLLPHIKPRIITEYVDGEPVQRILDKNGKPSAATLEDLEKEIENTDYLSALIIGSMASGSGDVGKKGNPVSKSMSRDSYNSIDPAAQSKFISEGGRLTD